MKSRNGFVSNSSSSSFILVSKNKEPLAEVLKEFNIPDTHPLSEPLNRSFIELMEDNSKKIKDISAYLKEYHYCNSIEEYLEMQGYQDIEEYLQSSSNDTVWFFYKFPNADIYFGAFESYGESQLESFMCNTEIDFENDKIIFKNPGSY